MTAKPVKLRTVRLDDAAAISQLQSRNGMGDVNAADLREGWDTHPFAAEFSGAPFGWVLETGDGEIVGFIGNVTLPCCLGDRRLRAAIASAWSVDAAYRGNS